jgi:hypothetical protein
MGRVTLALAIFIVGVLIFNVPISCALDATAIGSNTIIVDTQHAKPNLKDIKTNYTKVDTIYGPVNVQTETLKKLGKERITEAYSEFLKQKEEYRKMDEKLGIDKTYAAVNTVSSSQATAQQNAAPLRQGTSFQERCWFLQPSTVLVTALYGCVFPGTVSNPNNENFLSYQEREIYLNYVQNDYRDCIEVICQQYPDRSTDVCICIYDNSNYYVDSSIFSLVIHDVSHPIEYDVILNSAYNAYDIWLTDTVTGEYYFGSYTDSDNYSYFISYYSGATELEDYSLGKPTAQQYLVSCTFKDYYAVVGGSVGSPVPPYTVFSNIQHDASQPYVYAHGYQSSGLTYSDLAGGNPDPSH